MKHLHFLAVAVPLLPGVVAAAPTEQEILAELKKCPGVSTEPLSKTDKRLRVNLVGPFVSNDVLAKALSLESLRELRLGRTAITGAGLRDLSKAKGLSHLFLFENLHIRDKDYAALATLPLRELFVMGGEFGDEGMRAVSEMPDLETLSLAATDVTDDGIACVPALQKLKRLDVTSNLITDTGVASISKSRSLDNLHLMFCGRLSDASLTHLKNIETLKILTLMKLDLKGGNLDALAAVPNLEELFLANNGITDRQLASIGKLKQLRWLRLSEPAVGDEGIATLAPLAKLNHFNVLSTRVTVKGVAVLVNLPELQHLDVSGCNIGDDALAEIAKAKGLRKVILQKTQVTDEGIKALKKAAPDLEVAR